MKPGPVSLNAGAISTDCTTGADGGGVAAGSGSGEAACGSGLGGGASGSGSGGVDSYTGSGGGGSARAISTGRRTGGATVPRGRRTTEPVSRGLPPGRRRVSRASVHGLARARHCSRRAALRQRERTGIGAGIDAGARDRSAVAREAAEMDRHRLLRRAERGEPGEERRHRPAAPAGIIRLRGVGRRRRASPVSARTKAWVRQAARSWRRSWSSIILQRRLALAADRQRQRHPPPELGIVAAPQRQRIIVLRAPGIAESCRRRGRGRAAISASGAPSATASANRVKARLARAPSGPAPRPCRP